MSWLLGIVTSVVAYEFAAVTDFVTNVVFERAFESETRLAQMYGRLGWVVSGTALLSPLLLVPRPLPHKRTALLVPPIAMATATLGIALVPIVPIAIVLAASDRGLNYSLQQVTKESLYVPLSDAQKYKAKAFIDVFVNRAGKTLSSVALLAIIAAVGISIPACVALALGALARWAVAAASLVVTMWSGSSTGSMAAPLRKAVGAPRLRRTKGPRQRRALRPQRAVRRIEDRERESPPLARSAAVRSRSLLPAEAGPSASNALAASRRERTTRCPGSSSASARARTELARRSSSGRIGDAGPAAPGFGSARVGSGLATGVGTASAVCACFRSCEAHAAAPNHTQIISDSTARRAATYLRALHWLGNLTTFHLIP
jgi:hypothetical protein